MIYNSIGCLTSYRARLTLKTLFSISNIIIENAASNKIIFCLRVRNILKIFFEVYKTYELNYSGGRCLSILEDIYVLKNVSNEFNYASVVVIWRIFSQFYTVLLGNELSFSWYNLNFPTSCWNREWKLFLLWFFFGLTVS